MKALSDNGDYCSPELYLSDARGIHIPRDFVLCATKECVEDYTKWKEDLDFLADENNIDKDGYWDTWHKVLENIVIKHPTTGRRWSLYQDGDLFIIPYLKDCKWVVDAGPVYTIELESRYDEMLDECYEPWEFGSVKYYASKILKETDPTMYNIGYREWLDSQVADGQLFEHDGEYYEENVEPEQEDLEIHTEDFWVRDYGHYEWKI